MPGGGELTFDYAPPEHLRDRVAQAVRIAGACRIGHGVALPRGACATFVAGSDKAQAQWRHEALLARFEAGFRSRSPR